MIKNIYKILLKHYGPQHWWPVISKQNPKVEIIIGAILTQNTSWKNVEKALQNLIERNLIDFDKILNLSEEELKSYIRPAGFFNQKAKTLLRVAKFFVENSEPISRDALLKIKGIGKETADSILLYAYNQNLFVIDAYTRRLFYRLGLIEKELSYEELQHFISSNLPNNTKIYQEFHALIVIHCKDVCKKTPSCWNCVLNTHCKFFVDLSKSNEMNKH